MTTIQGIGRGAYTGLKIAFGATEELAGSSWVWDKFLPDSLPEGHPVARAGQAWKAINRVRAVASTASAFLAKRRWTAQVCARSAFDMTYDGVRVLKWAIKNDVPEVQRPYYRLRELEAVSDITDVVRSWLIDGFDAARTLYRTTKALPFLATKAKPAPSSPEVRLELYNEFLIALSGFVIDLAGKALSIIALVNLVSTRAGYTQNPLVGRVVRLKDWAYPLLYKSGMVNASLQGLFEIILKRPSVRGE